MGQLNRRQFLQGALAVVAAASTAEPLAGDFISGRERIEFFERSTDYGRSFHIIANHWCDDLLIDRKAIKVDMKPDDMTEEMRAMLKRKLEGWLYRLEDAPPYFYEEVVEPLRHTQGKDDILLA